MKLLVVSGLFYLVFLCSSGGGTSSDFTADSNSTTTGGIFSWMGKVFEVTTRNNLTSDNLYSLLDNITETAPAYLNSTTNGTTNFFSIIGKALGIFQRDGKSLSDFTRFSNLSIYSMISNSSELASNVTEPSKSENTANITVDTELCCSGNYSWCVQITAVIVEGKNFGKKFKNIGDSKTFCARNNTIPLNLTFEYKVPSYEYSARVHVFHSCNEKGEFLNFSGAITDPTKRFLYHTDLLDRGLSANPVPTKEQFRNGFYRHWLSDY